MPWCVAFGWRNTRVILGQRTGLWQSLHSVTPPSALLTSWTSPLSIIQYNFPAPLRLLLYLTSTRSLWKSCDLVWGWMCGTPPCRTIRVPKSRLEPLLRADFVLVEVVMRVLRSCHLSAEYATCCVTEPASLLNIPL